MRSRIGVVVGAIVVAGATSWANDARACGGCFHGEAPPESPESASVVTDHRMILALDTKMTTLWDQVEYAGDPRDFAWVLPTRGEVVVGVGSDAFMNAIDAMTTPTLHAPTPSCGYSGGGSSAGCGGGGSFAEDPTAGGSGGFDFETGVQDDSGVVVTGMSTVGPYAVVQVHGTDEGAIVGWLRAHHYVVPTDIEPMLQRYVDEGFDFVAVRLRPGAGVQAMRPIRVTFAGGYPTLPLRMVAAGVGATVGIKLFVVASGRWIPENFPTNVVDPATLTWDFANQRSDYTAQRQKQADAWDGRAFTLEASIDAHADDLPLGVGALPTGDAAVSDGDAETGVDALADVVDSDAEVDADADEADVEDTASDTRIDSTSPPSYDAGTPPIVDPLAPDRDVAFATSYIRRITRLRANLPSKYLDVDLLLQADSSQTELAPDINVTHGINDSAVCPPSSSSSKSMCECSLDESTRSQPALAWIGAGVALVAAGARLRRRHR